MKKIFAVAICSMLAGCASNKENVEITGQFYGQNDKKVFLEQLSPTGASMILDSALTDKNGKFSFNLELKDKYPVFYNIHMGGSYVPLLAEQGENIDVSAVGNIFYNYNVEGSKGSKLIKEYNTLLRNATLEMDSIITLYEKNIAEPALQQKLGIEYGQKYINLKRNAIKFVVSNANSLAALLPLYHPNQDGQFLFDQVEDFVYFQMVSDSLSSKYPDSPYALSLKSDMTKIMGAQQVDSMLSADLTQIDFPEIAMNDAQGKLQKLSDYKGNVILLDFTASNPAELKVVNRELAEVYSKFKDKGLVIYQVSLDVDKATWMNTVSQARIPWISVCDFNASASPAVSLYNVQKIPANFLIDKEGNIVAKNVYNTNLENWLNKVL